MIGRDAMRRYFISLLLLLIGTSLAFAQPFTRRSSQEKHDGLKKYYEISDFKLGGKYDLANPSKWENGGEGGVTLEFARRWQVAYRLYRRRQRTAQRSRRDHQRNRYQLVLLG